MPTLEIIKNKSKSNHNTWVYSKQVKIKSKIKSNTSLTYPNMWGGAAKPPRPPISVYAWCIWFYFDYFLNDFVYVHIFWFYFYLCLIIPRLAIFAVTIYLIISLIDVWLFAKDSILEKLPGSGVSSMYMYIYIYKWYIYIYEIRACICKYDM